MKIRHAKLALTLLLFSSTGVVAQLSVIEELERSRSVLYELEEFVDQTDPRLLEPLDQLANTLMALNQYDEAHAVLDRAMQVARINEGLYTPSQLPYLRKKIENYANRGDWESAQNLIDHLYWLYRTKTEHADGSLVEGLLHLSDIHLRGVSEDERSRQSYHFYNAAIHSRSALNVAEAMWGKDDPRLIPALYNQLKHYYFQSVAVERGGRVGYGLRQVSPRTGGMVDRETSQRIFYINGLRLLNQMKGIYAKAEISDSEGLAMTNLYLADWQVMFGKREEALESYQLSYLGMIESGMSKELINNFFSRPAVLPETNFYSTIDEAIKTRIDDGYHEDADAPDNPYLQLSFNKWSASFPNIRRPVNTGRVETANSNFALVSFNLAGLQEIPLQHGTRSYMAVGVVQDVVLIEQSLAPIIQKEELVEKLNWIRFRPKLVDGVPQRSSGVLKYLVAAGSR